MAKQRLSWLKFQVRTATLERLQKGYAQSSAATFAEFLRKIIEGGVPA